MTMLTCFKNISSSRATMNTSHLKQFVNLLKPDFPGVFMNTENLVGFYSTGYKEIDTESHVYKKVVKYKNIVDNPTQYFLFLYDEKKDYYYMVERKFGENLTEIFGFLYDNEVIDSYEEGDDIPPGTILYRSTSYDDDMLYGYGLNVPTLYTNYPYTAEDACIISESFAERSSSIECATISIGVNPNEFMLDLYGEGDEYKAFPDIGERTKGELTAVKRTLSTKHILVDFKDKNLKKIFESDTKYFKEGVVTDIDIFCNNYEELEDGPFTHQILKYLDAQTEYYQEINDICTEIMESGSSYSKDIDYMKKRSGEFLDPESKWRDNDREFSSLLIHITVSNIEPGHIGQKYTGRSGNKSVVSRIVPDDQMPYYYDDLGRKQTIHFLMANPGIVNRTTAFPLFEMYETYALRKLANRMEIARDKRTSVTKLADMMFEFLGDLNEDQAKKMRADFDKLSKKDQKAYIDACIDDRIHVAQSPYWEDGDIWLWNKLENVIKKYDWLTPDKVYIKKFGREIETLNESFIGDLYVMKLKQSPKKGFSARGIGSINSKGLPERSYKNKNFTEPHSRTPIRFGEFECLNFSIGMDAEDINLFYAFYRTSIEARRELARHVLTGEEFIPKKANYTSRTAEIFNVILKSLGIRLEFVEDNNDNTLYEADDENLAVHTYNGVDYLCSDFQFVLVERKKEVEKEILDVAGVMDTEMLDELIWDILMDTEYIVGVSKDEYAIQPAFSIPDTVSEYA